MNLGIVQAMLKEYNESETSYYKALFYKKNYPNCYYNLGNLYIELQNYSMALKMWHTAASLKPKHQKAWSNILTFYDNKGLHDEVLKVSK
jgi:tetratricopeptide (TPR) repeat protein